MGFCPSGVPAFGEINIVVVVVVIVILHSSFLLYFVADDGDNSTSTDSDGVCSCISQCNMITYSSTVSTARLSDSSILNSTAGLESRVSRGFLEALEIAERVDEDSMLHTIQQLQKVLDAHDRFKTLIMFHVVSEATSGTERLLSFSDSINEMLRRTIRLSNEMLRVMDQNYAQYFEYLVTDLTTTIQTANRLCAQLTASFVTKQPPDNNEMIQSLSKELTSVVDKLHKFRPDLYNSFKRALFPKQLFTSPACQNDKENLNYTANELNVWLNGFPIESKFDNKTDLHKASNLRSLLSRTANCMTVYQDDLDSFGKWLNSVRVPELALSTSLSMSDMEVIKVDGNNLRDIQQRFIRGFLTKKRLTEDLTIIIKRMQTHATKVANEISQSVFTKLYTNINSVEESMKLFFRKLFTTYVRLQKYMDNSDTEIEKNARKQDIWRKPAVNFQSTHVCTNTCFISTRNLATANSLPSASSYGIVS